MTVQFLAQALAPAGTFLSWGLFGIQFGNLVVILVMVALFLLALVLPFPAGRSAR